MNIDLILLLIFGVTLLILMILGRKNAELEKIAFPFLYLYMYKTKIGLKAMDTISKKFKKSLGYVGTISIITGFIGMFTILSYLLFGTYKFFFQNQPSPIQLLLPGVVQVPGIPNLSFFHWIIAIFVLAGVHEFSHGVFARLRKIKIKSSGFAIFGVILPIIPAAFVEPDEKQLANASKKTQLEVLSAGAFANIVTAALTFLLFIFLIAPAANSTMDYVGVQIAGFDEISPTMESGMQVGEEIVMIQGNEITRIEDFISAIGKVEPYERITIQTENSTYNVLTAEHPEDSERAYLGVQVTPSKQTYRADLLQKVGMFPLQVLTWIKLMFFWIFVANLGVGLFNLLPISILDGGRMSYIALEKIMKDEKKAEKIWKVISTSLLAIILILLLPQFYNLLIAPIIGLLF
ncbi:site-2 protease family protein [archaeon]|jgi:membrane-associated protease RseP (regulator of RpoE activity)|nr:site-2 protease family protein [archaeon]